MIQDQFKIKDHIRNYKSHISDKKLKKYLSLKKLNRLAIQEIIDEIKISWIFYMIFYIIKIYKFFLISWEEKELRNKEMEPIISKVERKLLEKQTNNKPLKLKITIRIYPLEIIWRTLDGW